ncbi:DUF3105 domain-containing protein [Candidatus Kaiserbacteria bacterium]|nr:MAG: DUF3105 domain-containing protein [Candidatus Kaiserbacteria bacterium]
MQNEENINQEPQLSRKEKIDNKRAAKEHQRARSIRSKKIKKIAVWLVVFVALGALIYWGISAAEKSEEARPGKQVAVMGAGHITIGATHDPYNTNPPTSGAHGAPVNFGVYQDELIDENVVHNLEHGGIWISYKDLSQEDIQKLEDIGRNYSGRTVVSPRSANDSNIAVASWGRLLELDTVDVEQITEYVKRNFNRSPEQLAR